MATGITSIKVLVVNLKSCIEKLHDSKAAYSLVADVVKEACELNLPLLKEEAIKEAQQIASAQSWNWECKISNDCSSGCIQIKGLEDISWEQ